MDVNAIPVGENTTVIVKASGDLFLEGSDQPEVRFQSSEDRIRVNQSNGTLYVETHASMDLLIPRNVNLIIEKVGGSAFLQDLDAALVVQKVGGDLALQRMGAVRIEKVGGGCQILDINGALEINKIGGDLTVRQAHGPVQINHVGGEGDLQVMSSGPLSARAGGDMLLYLMERVDGPITVRAGGEVRIFLPVEVSANLSLTSDGETINLMLSGERQILETRHHELTLGEGGALIEARAGGDIRVTDEAQEPVSIAEELSRRESAWVEARERRGHSSWSGGFGFDRSSAWADMISRRAQEAARRAEQRAQSAMRRTEEQIRQAAERELRRSEHRWGSQPPRPPAPPTPEPVTEQERLLVLQMLQEQKITVEQAEKLLAALEGRFDR